MEEKNKPSVEEMFEAYSRYSRRIDEAFRQCPPIRVDFDKMPLRRRKVSRGRLQSLVVAMILVVLCLSTIPHTYAMSPGADHVGTRAIVEFMLNNMKSL